MLFFLSGEKCCGVDIFVRHHLIYFSKKQAENEIIFLLHLHQLYFLTIKLPEKKTSKFFLLSLNERLP